MDQSTFNAADPLVDEIAELIDHALTSDQLASLRQSLAKRERAPLPLLLSSVCCWGGEDFLNPGGGVDDESCTRFGEA
jgi:hypothetical protein